ncbi:glycoside hydrolase family 5 protein (plasmid) [Deinococcus sp. KNUC1210]|uniref:glycoside hydrolase family 5 protein n=1 Tax=Deinococcus sp. KNUC1210 TaxID=2917691 RepID=UPI001EF0F78F|nr:glycoside hydrolase family 5 protein [Deinococcus sp. KNUC1210]ULH18021.1 glycoside hydrolase family 5 protein [Deinococcus sp. KNUC1210]
MTRTNADVDHGTRPSPLTAEAFRHPAAEFRGVPFWSWNSTLRREQLERQAGIFSHMGMGGYHLHSRTGLNTPYLGDEFMARVTDAVTWAKRDGLKVWLYDEDRWPSGFAGGSSPANRASARAICSSPPRRTAALISPRR